MYHYQIPEFLEQLSGGDSSYPIYVMDDLVEFADQEKYTVNTDKLLE